MHHGPVEKASASAPTGCGYSDGGLPAMSSQSKSMVQVRRTQFPGDRWRAGLPRFIAAAALAVSLASIAAGGALAQSEPPSAQPQRSEPRGVFEAIGRFFDQGAANVRSHLRSAKERMDNLGDEAAANRRELGERAAEVGKGAAEATKSAVDTMIKLPKARVMTGRERCVTAPNGAPDCVAAAEALCRKHGYASGTSMDFTQAEECPPRALLSGRQSAECSTVTFISRAMCQ
jgi:hypothetical protein